MRKLNIRFNNGFNIGLLVVVVFSFSAVHSQSQSKRVPLRTPTAEKAAPPTANSQSAPTAAPPQQGGEPKVSFADAQPEDITDANFPDMIDSFDYPNAEIMDVVKAISKLTGKNFIIDRGVTGKISIIAPTRITKAEAYRAFLSALAINGFTIVPSGKFLKIRPVDKAKLDNIETYGGAYYPNSDQLITRIVHLKYISAEEIFNKLRGVFTRSGEVSAYQQTNSLIITDFGSNVERVMRILTQLDVPTFEEQLEVIHVQHAKAKDLAELIEQILNKGEKTPKGGAPSFRTSAPRFGGPDAQKTESYFVIPDERTNALIVVGNKQGISKITKLIKRLDYRLSAEESSKVHVYYIRYGEAEAIANVLSGIAKDSAAQQKDGAGGAGSRDVKVGMAPATPAEPIFGGDVKVVADKTNNSLIITANQQDYKQVRMILDKIDIQRDQVYVEAIILEMTSYDRDEFKPNFYVFGDSSGNARQGFRSGPLPLDPQNDSGLVLGFASGDDVTLKLPNGITATVKSLTGFLNLLKSNTKTNILSTPQIMALDNEDAEIEVGDNVPIGADTVNTAAGSTTSIKREKATIKLKIKPFISPDSDMVHLKIDQKVVQLTKNLVDAEQIAKAAAQLTERSLLTNIVLTSGDTAVLGGLMKDRVTETVTKVPLLGDIPILGWLFKSKEDQTEKVNLLVFITPKIIRTRRERIDLMGQKLNDRIDFVKKRLNGKDPFGETFDALQQKNLALKKKIEEEGEAAPPTNESVESVGPESAGPESSTPPEESGQ